MGSVSSGNLSAFDITSSEVCEMEDKLILLPLETGKVPRDNTVILLQNLATNVPSRLTQLIIASCFVNVAQGWGGDTTCQMFKYND